MYALMSDFTYNCHVSLIPRLETTRLLSTKQSAACDSLSDLDGCGPSAGH